MPKGLTKKRDARLAAILDAASELFAEKGYEATTVADILDAVGMGKGTFYHYFDSKQEVLEAFVERLTAQVVERANTIAADPELDAHSKLVRLVASISLARTPDGAIIDELHRPDNARLRHRSLVETIRQVAPIMARVVEQGVAEGVYSTPRPLETVEFLLVGISAILDQGFFDWTPQTLASRAAEVARVTELALGAAPGSFAFLASPASDR
ncbi:MAG: TetR/AcrR family transcriptional regulator [Propionibacteriaceae bacterium]|jgi:AcrR family transcriptional regulator|nr:TetR/AcrR family transcriptional regulator [Propionibacteriaceae bacterium]